MAVDMEQLQRIHRIEGEVKAAEQNANELKEKRVELIQELPEYQALQDALAAVRDARARLKIAIREDSELANLEEERAEALFRLRDLREILSHHLVAYHEDTGRDVVKDHESRNRQIELKAKLGKPTLDQARLPLGFGRHFGQHVEIPAPPTPQHLEVTPEPAS
jgi:hypothetical protein